MMDKSKRNGFMPMLYRDSSYSTYEKYKKRDGITTEDELFYDLFNILTEGCDSGGTMGFHINPKKLGFDIPSLEPSEMKFYINAGSDTYKVANLFWRECYQKDIPYRFKVVSPLRGGNECQRPDKLCIYMAVEHAPMFYEILTKIKNENMDIRFDTPPILTGRIDDFIGVGMDTEGTSYNNFQSGVIEDAVKKTFHDVEKEKIYAYAQKHPEKIEEFRRAIVLIGKQLGMSSEKGCVFESKVKQLKSIKLHSQRRLNSIDIRNSFKNKGITTSEQNSVIHNIRSTKNPQENNRYI